MNIRDIQFKEVVATSDPCWENDAKALAESETAFVIVGFDGTCSFHLDFYKAMKANPRFDSRLEIKTRRAYFWPKISN